MKVENEQQSGAILDLGGLLVHRGYLAKPACQSLVAQLRDVIRAAPLFSPITPSGKSMSVRMTSAGRLGWIADARGYRYSPTHPRGTPWPAIPEAVLSIWRDLVGGNRLPDCCLLNFYGEGARMGMHRDADEAAYSYPVVSISLGDDGLLCVGGLARGGKTARHWLTSGDVVVMGGAARLAYHGVDRIRFGSSSLLPKGGRINLTLRVVGAD
nr:alpha-ketoglutarate-dependent dioxygenase AlkB [Aquimixticola soesokkakensis]